MNPVRIAPSALETPREESFPGIGVRRGHANPGTRESRNEDPWKGTTPLEGLVIFFLNFQD